MKKAEVIEVVELSDVKGDEYFLEGYSNDIVDETFQSLVEAYRESRRLLRDYIKAEADRHQVTEELESGGLIVG